MSILLFNHQLISNAVTNRRDQSILSLMIARNLSAKQILGREISPGDTTSPYARVIRYRNEGKPVTADVVNDIQRPLGRTITQADLDLVLNAPRHTFKNLTRATPKTRSFIDVAGDPKGLNTVSAIYIWTQSNGDQYVGSSVNFANRMKTHFGKLTRPVGNFQKLLKRLTVSKFTLTIIPTNNLATTSTDLELLVEQYFLIAWVCKLNFSLIVTSPGSGTGLTTYMLTKDRSRVIYTADSKLHLVDRLRVRAGQINDSIAFHTPYLGNYIFSSTPVEGAVESGLTLQEVREMLATARGAIIRSNQSPITVTLETDKSDTRTFPSKEGAVEFLQFFGKANRETLRERCQSGQPYNGYICVELHPVKRFVDQSHPMAITDTIDRVKTTYESQRAAARSFDPPYDEESNVPRTSTVRSDTLVEYAKYGKLFQGRYRIEIMEDVNVAPIAKHSRPVYITDLKSGHIEHCETLRLGAIYLDPLWKEWLQAAGEKLTTIGHARVRNLALSKAKMTNGKTGNVLMDRYRVEFAPKLSRPQGIIRVDTVDSRGNVIGDTGGSSPDPD